MSNLSRDFTNSLKQSGFNFFSGVPCSFLQGVINQAIIDPELVYVPATNEGEAVALATGAWLSGQHAVVMCQNSGLGNMINPLTSLNSTFGIPILLIVTHRGKPGTKDEPQHKLMGEITIDLLKLLGISTVTLSSDSSRMKETVSFAYNQVCVERKTTAIIIEKNTFLDEPSTKISISDLPSRFMALKSIIDLVQEQDILVATTGKTGRELFTINDRDNSFYCVGSMGYASAIAQGIALCIPQRKVIVIDGDGAALMHLGNMANIGYLGSMNLVHIILDNGTYDSTGGQETVSKEIDFTKLALGVGYSQAQYCSSLNMFKDAYNELDKRSCGPNLLVVNISKGSLENLGRPSISPTQVANRFKSKIKEYL